MSPNGRRALNVGMIALALLGAGLWFYSGEHVNTAIFLALSLLWIAHTVAEWNRVHSDQTLAHAGRSQLIVGAVLLVGVVVWWLLRGRWF